MKKRLVSYRYSSKEVLILILVTIVVFTSITLFSQGTLTGKAVSGYEWQCSDEGDNLYQAETLTIYRYGQTFETKPDECVDSGKLRQYTCVRAEANSKWDIPLFPGVLERTTHDCTCINGACINPAATCGNNICENGEQTTCLQDCDTGGSPHVKTVKVWDAIGFNPLTDPQGVQKATHAAQTIDIIRTGLKEKSFEELHSIIDPINPNMIYTTYLNGVVIQPERSSDIDCNPPRESWQQPLTSHLWKYPNGSYVLEEKHSNCFIKIQETTSRNAFSSGLLNEIKKDRALGYDGVFIDQFAEKTIEDEALPPDYKRSSYRQALLKMAQTLGTQPYEWTVYNGLCTTELSRGVFEPPSWEYLPYFGGCLEELFSYNGGTGNNFKKSVMSIRFTEAMQLAQQNKKFIIVEKGNNGINDMQKRNYGLANYLIVNSPTTYYNFQDLSVNDDLQTFPEYTLAIGQPVAATYTQAPTECTSGDCTGVYKRAYTGGIAFTNINDEGTIKLTFTQDMEQLELIGGGPWNPTDNGKLKWNKIGKSINLNAKEGTVVRVCTSCGQTTQPPGAICGNGICEAGETCTQDCEIPAPVPQDVWNCQQDPNGVTLTRNDGLIQEYSNECVDSTKLKQYLCTKTSAATKWDYEGGVLSRTTQDCECSNNACSDTDVGPVCGNGICEAGETCTQDCGTANTEWSCIPKTNGVTLTRNDGLTQEYSNECVDSTKLKYYTCSEPTQTTGKWDYEGGVLSRLTTDCSCSNGACNS